jgi:hypothetical protein
MAKPSTPDDLYRFGRSYPNGQPHERRHPSPPRASDYGRHEEVQRNQAPEDAHDNKGGSYDNDVSANSWLRSDGTKKPSFDNKGNAWRMKDSNNWNSGHDRAVIRSPGKNTPDRKD